jgi:hypothetical protein
LESPGEERFLMLNEVVIYAPPRKGLPYLVVTFEGTALNAVPFESITAARTAAVQEIIRRRRPGKPGAA